MQTINSPDRSKRLKKSRKRQEAYWARKAGPVTVTRVEPKPRSVTES